MSADMEQGATKVLTETGAAVVSVATENVATVAAPEESASAPPAMTFESGLPDCCSVNPDSYKVVAELPGARLVEMKLPPGETDVPHDHPAHSMYVLSNAKLEIAPVSADGTVGEAGPAEIPAGAAPIMPPGAHQVKNVGEAVAHIIFVESYPDAKPGDEKEGFVSPFDTCGNFYKKLAEDDNWVTGEVTMEPEQADTLHNHRDHFIYVMEGDELTIFPDGDMDKGAVVPIKPFAAVPAPEAAGSIFTNHIVKNSGKAKCRLIFFEKKK